jgi:hypothetical protein
LVGGEELVGELLLRGRHLTIKVILGSKRVVRVNWRSEEAGRAELSTVLGTFPSDSQVREDSPSRTSISAAAADRGHSDAQPQYSRSAKVFIFSGASEWYFG